MLKVLGICSAVAMVLSAFVPWFKTPFGQSFVPWDLVELVYNMDSRSLTRMTNQSMPPALIAFGASFLAPILFLLFGATSRLLSGLAGLMPFVCIAILLSPTNDLPQSSGATMNIFDTIDWNSLSNRFFDFAGAGLTFWFGGAISLLLLSVLSFGPKRST